MFHPLTLRQKGALALGLLVLLLLPLVSSDSYLMHVLVLSMIFGVFASAWNLVTGFAGMKTFGHHASSAWAPTAPP